MYSVETGFGPLIYTGTNGLPLHFELGLGEVFYDSWWFETDARLSIALGPGDYSFSISFQGNGSNSPPPGDHYFGIRVDETSPVPVPLPPSIVSQLIGLAMFGGLLAWRRKRKGAATTV